MNKVVHKKTRKNNRPLGPWFSICKGRSCWTGTTEWHKVTCPACLAKKKSPMESNETRILRTIIKLLRKNKVKIDSPYDLENWLEDNTSHSKILKTGEFKTNVYLDESRKRMFNRATTRTAVIGTNGSSQSCSSCGKAVTLMADMDITRLICDECAH